MSHELSFYEGKAEMMYQKGEVPWTGLGTPVDTAAKAAGAMEAAHLGWMVEKRALFYQDNDGQYARAKIGTARAERDKDAYVTVRADTGRALGIVSEEYQVVQNAEAFVFLDALLGAELRYETAGALFGGRRVWMLAHMPGDINVGSGDEPDLIKRYLLLVNGHDGARSINVLVTPVRVVCNNTLTAALERGAESGIVIRHTGDVQEKLKWARDTLAQASKTFDAYAVTFRRLIEVRIGDAETGRYFERVFSPDDKTESNHDREMVALVLSLRQGAGSGYATARGTLWGAYNAVVDYVDHVRGTKDPEQRLNSIVWGSGMRIKSRAYAVALGVACGDVDLTRDAAEEIQTAVATD